MHQFCVIGGGVVGLAVAHELTLRGLDVVLLEREQHCASGAASAGNSALGHPGYDASGLEAQLLRRSQVLHPGIYRSFGMSMDHVQKCGSLVVAYTPEELERLHQEFDGPVLVGDDLRTLEPCLAGEALGAMFVDGEACVEPTLVYCGFQEAIERRGGTIRTRFAAAGAHHDADTASWFVWTADGRHVQSQVVINCAGLHGDQVEAQLRGAKTPKFTIAPRKGQFVVLDVPEEYRPRHIIEQLPSERTKGLIVWTTVHGQVVVGPTADDVNSRTDRSTDPETTERLLQFGERVIPGLRQHGNVVGTYAGIRPATEHRDYQISVSAMMDDGCGDDSWAVVGGIRSTGLSGCTGIAEYVCNQLLGESPRAFDEVRLPSIPPLAELRLSRDNTLSLYEKEFTVAHPISLFGITKM